MMGLDMLPELIRIVAPAAFRGGRGGSNLAR